MGHAPQRARHNSLIGYGVTCLALSLLAPAAVAQPPKPGDEDYKVEWVYRFRKYQIPILDRAEELGYVLDCHVYHPMLHADEAARWDYRVEITYRDFDAASHEAEITADPFGDSETRKREENRRWELTTNHWDLPIYEVDTTKPR